MKLTKYELNPVFKPTSEQPWEERCVLNPAVVFDESTDRFVMLYRAAGNDVEHIIRLGLATSTDGIHFTRESKDPVFESHRDEADGGCVEDPRLTKIGDTYFMTYASRAYAPGQYWLDGAPFPPIYLNQDDPAEVYSEDLPYFARKNITVSYLAATKDFRHYKKLGRLTESNIDDRDVVIFPEKVEDKFVMISRPKFDTDLVKMPSVWISFTSDLTEYETPKLLMTGEQWWETRRIGAGTPPIRTEYGWFMLYHGVDDNGVYRVGAVLMDLDDPAKIICRTKDFIMEPDMDFELCGIYNGCVFPTGTVVKNGILYVYYGCADEYIGLATANFDELLNYLVKECKL